MMASFKQVGILAAAAVLVFIASGVPSVAGLPPPWVRTFPFSGQNIAGDLLVLDYGSLSPGTVMDSEAKCEKACKTLLGCNAYVYCNSATGCGNSCAKYVQGHPKLALPSGTSNYKTQALPITAFGGYQKGSGCVGSKWKPGLCSLKHVADTANPTFSTETSSGWRSGVINMTEPPWTCAGLPFGLCELCTNYWAYDKEHPSYDPCITCGATITKGLPGGKAANLEQATRQYACSWCFTEDPKNVEKDRSQCLKCVPKHAGKGLHNLCTY